MTSQNAVLLNATNTQAWEIEITNAAAEAVTELLESRQKDTILRRADVKEALGAILDRNLEAKRLPIPQDDATLAALEAFEEGILDQATSIFMQQSNPTLGPDHWRSLRANQLEAAGVTPQAIGYRVRDDRHWAVKLLHTAIDRITNDLSRLERKGTLFGSQPIPQDPK